MKYLAFLIATLLATPSLANDSMPLFYTRETLTIQRMAQTPLPEGEAQPPSSLGLDVEVRDAKSFYNQKDWFNLSGPTDDSGVLLVFAQPGQSPIIASKQFAPLDILFIDAQGRITQIIPNILLSNLSQQIIPQNAVLAFLFIKGQSCQRLGINPGDVVDYKIFSKPPIVLGDPVSIITDAPRQKKPAPQPSSRPIPVMPSAPKAVPTSTVKFLPENSGQRINVPPLPPLPETPRAKLRQEKSLETPSLNTKEPVPKPLAIRPGE